MTVSIVLTLTVLSRGSAVEFRGLGALAGGKFESHAWDVSADGQVVVGSSSSKNGEKEAFRWTTADGMLGLSGLRDPRFDGIRADVRIINSQAHGVSDDGKVVVGHSLAGSTRAFRWTSVDGMQDLGSLPGQFSASIAHDISGDGLTVVGRSSSGFGHEAFWWAKARGMQGIGHLRGRAKNSIALAISKDGTTIVGSSDSSNGLEAFRWTSSGGIQGLGDLPGGRFQSQATDVSGDGSIVVGSGYHTGTEQQAWKWTADGGMQGLGDLPGGAFYSTASAVSRDGSTIVGAGYSEKGSEAVRWTGESGVQSIQQLLIDRGIGTLIPARRASE